MIESDDEIEKIDRSQWLPHGTPLLHPERIAKGDVITGPECNECNGTGKEKHMNLVCKKCYGHGWCGETSAIDVPISDIRFAQVQVRNILNYLWSAGHITDENHDDGHTFEAWRNQHRVAMGLQKAISTDTAQSTGVKLRAYGYVLIIKRMSINDFNAVSMAIDTFEREYTRHVADKDRKIYSRAFACLTTAMMPIREQISYLEGLTDEERDELCEGRLKSFLDRIHENA